MLETKRAEAVGQYDLFGGFGSDPDGDGAGVGVDLSVPLGEWDKATLLAAERDMLGLYVSDHPLFGLEHVLAAASDASVASLTGDDRPDGQVVTVGGLVTSVAHKTTKQTGAHWCIATLEDLEGSIEVMVFPQTYALVSQHVFPDAVLIVRGRIDKREEESPKLVAMEISVPDLTEGPRGPVVISLAANRCVPPVVARLKEVLAAHPGITEVHLRLVNGARTTLLNLDDRLRVTPSPALYGDLKALLGPSCLG